SRRLTGRSENCEGRLPRLLLPHHLPYLPESTVALWPRQKEGPRCCAALLFGTCSEPVYESLRSRRRRTKPVARSVNPIRTVTSSDTPVKGSVCAPATAPAAVPLTSPALCCAGSCAGGCGFVPYWADAEDLCTSTLSLC